MDWCRLGTSYYLDEAVLRAGEAAEVLFLRCLAYSGARESRGRIDKAALPLLAPVKTKARMDALVREGLLVDEGDAVLIRRWDEWQEALDSESERRRKDRERKRADRAAVRAASSDVSADNPRTIRTLNPRIELEVEEELQTTSVVTRGKRALPSDWQPTEADLAWAKTECPLVNVHRETASFCDYFHEKRVKRENWSLSWRPWMRKAQSDAENRQPLRAVPSDRLGSWDV